MGILSNRCLALSLTRWLYLCFRKWSLSCWGKCLRKLCDSWQLGNSAFTDWIFWPLMSYSSRCFFFSSTYLSCDFVNFNMCAFHYYRSDLDTTFTPDRFPGSLGASWLGKTTNLPQVWARPRWRVSKVVTAWVSKMRLTSIAKTLSFKCGKQLLRSEILVASLNSDFLMLQRSREDLWIAGCVNIR